MPDVVPDASRIPRGHQMKEGPGTPGGAQPENAASLAKSLRPPRERELLENEALYIQERPGELPEGGNWKGATCSN